MIDFDDVNLAFDQLPERAIDPPLDMESSFPLLREIDGTLYVVSMIYLYGEHYPNRFYRYNTKTKEAESLSFKEGLQRMNIKEFPLEGKYYWAFAEWE